MYNGVHNMLYNEPIADFAAKRVLGMSGSILNYINTGNAYTPGVYANGLKRDTFSTKMKSKKRTDNLIVAAFLALTAGTILFTFSKNKKLDFLKKGLDSIKGIFKKKPAQ